MITVLIILSIAIIGTQVYYQKKITKLTKGWSDKLILSNDQLAFLKKNPKVDTKIIDVKKGKRKYTLLFARVPGKEEIRFNLGRHKEL